MINRQRIFDWTFISVGLLVQAVTFWIEDQSWLSLLSGCLGICSVCMASQGRILTYLFGFGQVITYMCIVISQHFYAQIALNAFYFVTMIYGVYVWRSRTQSDAKTISPRSIRPVAWIPLLVGMAAASVLTGWGLSVWTEHSQPYLDAFTTIPALVAQVLMILAYRDHWFIWLAVDVLNVVLWVRAGDYCMAAQYSFWCANCLYGLRRWSTLSSHQ